MDNKLIGNNIDFDNMLVKAVSLPYVNIDRDTYLRKELSVYCDHEMVETAIAEGTKAAGISVYTIDSIADGAIKFEVGKTSAASFLSGIPGGLALLGTIPADLAQYLAHVLRISQKLAYLYGFKEFNLDSLEELDDNTRVALVLLVGVALGVNGANNALAKFAETLGGQVAKNVAKSVMAKSAVYSVVNKIAKTIGIKMSKDIFAKGVTKVVPLIGGAVSGGVTYVAFSTASKNLKKTLRDIYISGTRNGNTSAKSDLDFIDI